MTDIFAGICTGVAQNIVGYPFDTVKVRMQNKQRWYGMRFKNYYKGWQYPMFSSILFNATVFPVHERSMKYMDSHYTSGLISGIFVSPLLFGFKIGEIKKQTNKPLKLETFYKTKGLPALTLREGLAMSLYFGVYNDLKKYDLPIFMAGGLSGLANWTFTYPIDVVMSRQISQNITIREAIKQKNMWRGFKVCAIRAGIVNACNFWVYETVYNIFK